MEVVLAPVIDDTDQYAYVLLVTQRKRQTSQGATSFVKTQP